MIVCQFKICSEISFVILFLRTSPRVDTEVLALVSKIEQVLKFFSRLFIIAVKLFFTIPRAEHNVQIVCFSGVSERLV